MSEDNEHVLYVFVFVYDLMARSTYYIEPCRQWFSNAYHALIL